MTFCLAMKVREGLLAISDSRITSGGETSTASKVAVNEEERHSMFVMTSGLRSARDKALTYFEDTLEQTHATFDKPTRETSVEELNEIVVEEYRRARQAALGQTAA